MPFDKRPLRTSDPRVVPCRHSWVGSPARKLIDDRLLPDRILQLGFGLWRSKALLSAVELGLFTELARSPADATVLAQRLELHPALPVIF